MKNWLGILISYVAIFFVIVMAKLFEKKGSEASRKFIHIALGNWWFIAMYFFDNVWYATFVPATFVIINYLSYKKDLIKVMEREENIKDGPGTVYYALSLLIITIITFGIIKKPILGLVPILIMAYGDGFAAVIGKLVKSTKYKVFDSQKSIAGSATMFMISLIILTIYLIYINSPLWYIKSLIIALLLTFVEAISIRGTDNITVPIVCLLILLFCFI